MTAQPERTIDLGVFYMEPPILALDDIRSACYTACILKIAQKTLQEAKPFDTVSLEDGFLAASIHFGVSLATVLRPVSVAITSKSMSSALFADMIAIGKEESVLRVENAFHSLRRSLAKSAAHYQGQIDNQSTLNAIALILDH